MDKSKHIKWFYLCEILKIQKPLTFCLKTITNHIYSFVKHPSISSAAMRLISYR